MRGPLLILRRFARQREDKSMTLRLRPYKPMDTRHIVTWVKDHDTFSAWCADYLDWPLTEASLEAFCHAFDGQEDRWLMTALDERGVPVGFLMMSQADYAGNRIHLGLIIVDSSRRGQGLGTALLRLVLDYARDILGMQRVTLRVFDHNTAARACYRKVGFREVSLEKESFPHGEVSWDCWNMEALL